MKDIKIIEEIKRDEKEQKTIVRFTIAYFPAEGSLKIESFERSFCVTDLELVTHLATDMFDRMRLDNATTVFRDYYKSIFLK